MKKISTVVSAFQGRTFSTSSHTHLTQAIYLVSAETAVRLLNGWKESLEIPETERLFRKRRNLPQLIRHSEIPSTQMSLIDLRSQMKSKGETKYRTKRHLPVRHKDLQKKYTDSNIVKKYFITFALEISPISPANFSKSIILN